jgi:hypothetical protein
MVVIYLYERPKVSRLAIALVPAGCILPYLISVLQLWQRLSERSEQVERSICLAIEVPGPYTPRLIF